MLVLLTNPFLDFEEWSETAMPRVLAGSCQSDTGQSINLFNKALPSYMYDVICPSIYSWVWMDGYVLTVFIYMPKNGCMMCVTVQVFMPECGCGHV